MPQTTHTACDLPTPFNFVERSIPPQIKFIPSPLHPEILTFQLVYFSGGTPKAPVRLPLLR